MNDTYAIAYTQILEILKYLSGNELEKIPKEKLELYSKNKETDYEFQFDISRSINEQNISRKAKAIYVSLYKKYIANENERAMIKRVLENNYIVNENRKKELYNSDNIFKNKETKNNNQQLEQNVSIVPYKVSMFLKIINRIKKFFNL